MAAERSETVRVDEAAAARPDAATQGAGSGDPFSPAEVVTVEQGQRGDAANSSTSTSPADRTARRRGANGSGKGSKQRKGRRPNSSASPSENRASKNSASQNRGSKRGASAVSTTSDDSHDVQSGRGAVDKDSMSAPSTAVASATTATDTAVDKSGGASASPTGDEPVAFAPADPTATPVSEGAGPAKPVDLSDDTGAPGTDPGDELDGEMHSVDPGDDPAVTEIAAPKGRRFRAGPLRARLVRRTVRQIDPWSVLRLSFLFFLSMWVVGMIASVLLWQTAVESGLVESIEELIEELFQQELFRFEPAVLFRATALGGLALALGATAMATLMAVLFNLIADLVGGVRLLVVEEERSRRWLR